MGQFRVSRSARFSSLPWTSSPDKFIGSEEGFSMSIRVCYLVLALVLLSSGFRALGVESSEGAGGEQAVAQHGSEDGNQTFAQYLEKSVVTRAETDRFLQGRGWAIFDPELGYVLGNSMLPWGIDGSSTIETVQPNGARTSFLYRDRTARINAYGDSFTECAQVSDGETWEEYLAGHLGEPIRNFGVGGFGVYQAYRRMLREERTDHAAQYLILTICCDDSTRSLYRARWAAIYPWFRDQAERNHIFHANFWSNVEMDLNTGHFVEKPQLLPTGESLYHMTEPQWMAEHLKDDLALELTAYSAGRIGELDRQQISRLAACLDFPFDWSLQSRTDTAPVPDATGPRRTPMQAQAAALLNRYSQRATLFILEKVRAFTRENGKTLLVVLNGTADIAEMKARGTRDDQAVVDYLVKERIPYVDINAILLQGFKLSNLSKADYMKPYLVNGGHFNPMGNHFIAYAIKDKLLELLDPKPVPYQLPDAQAISFKGYLHGGMYDVRLSPQKTK